jgi:hypothetical protein
MKAKSGGRDHPFRLPLLSIFQTQAESLTAAFDLQDHTIIYFPDSAFPEPFPIMRKPP